MSRLVESIAPARLGRDFRWLLASSWVGQIGDGIVLAAGPLLVASQTRNAFLVGLAAALQRVPTLFFGLIAGAIADRHDRKRLVVVANAARILVLAMLIGTLTTGHVSIGIVLAAMLALGCAEIFADTSFSTLLPMVVTKPDLGLGNSRLMAGFLTGNQLVGPPVGAFLFAAGMAWPFVTQLLSLAVSAVLVLRIATPTVARPDREPTHIRRDIDEGVRWLLGNAPVRTLALVILAFNVTWGAAWSVLVLYALDHLHLGEVGFGLLTTAAAVGGMASTAAYGRLERRFDLATLMRACLTLEVVTHFALALNRSGAVAIGIMVVFGAYAFVWGTLSTAVRQRAVPTEFQGRVSSVYVVALFGGLVVGQVLGGLIAQMWGVTAPFWFAGVGAGLTLLLVWRELAHIAHAEVSP
ncbi:MFS transporter [Nostocoides jenkinsii]|uniref:Major facilitator superfamily MFS_1 n=1 Tax=Nostocoides jenkinsii Ben 74 TaxID=1193518 RepID=A0A077MAF0_9MICO|nr:MFS transporter [Tetrasphaera jenkinsii]CCI54346.1 Major facilitator superfamily MFS_1 [Tetrasphaera jenkinsii Ben 74]